MKILLVEDEPRMAGDLDDHVRGRAGISPVTHAV
jgi:hypothetical protein